MSTQILASRELVLNVVKDLAAAWPTKRSDAELARMAAVWYDALGDLPDRAIQWAKKRAIQEEKFFPRVAVIRDLALRHVQFERKQQEADIAKIDDGMICPSCHTRYEPRRFHVPKADPNVPGRPFLLSADGEYLLLDGAERLLCDCHKPLFVRDTHVEPAAVHLSRVRMGITGPTRRSDVVMRQAATA